MAKLRYGGPLARGATSWLAGKRDAIVTVAVPRLGWARSTVIVPAFPGRLLTQMAPAPPVASKGNCVSPASDPGPVMVIARDPDA